MYRKNLISLLIPIAAVLLLGSCKFFDSSFIIIKLPDPPNTKVVSWIIEYPEFLIEGKPAYKEKHVDSDSLVIISRGINLPVFAWPIFDLDSDSNDPVSFRGSFPAGAIYPIDISGGSLELNWEDGFACEIIRSCLLNSEVVRSFNTVRFRESISMKAVELKDEEGVGFPGGSYLLDPVPIIARLGYGLFRESSITGNETMSFSIPVSASAGIWVSDNHLYSTEVLNQACDEGMLGVIVPLNRKTSFMNYISGEIIEVFFNDNSWCWTNLLTGASESGRR